MRRTLALGIGFPILAASLFGCGAGEETTDVKSIQAAAKSQVPAGLPAVPPERIAADTHGMGPRGSGKGK